MTYEININVISPSNRIGKHYYMFLNAISIYRCVSYFALACLFLFFISAKMKLFCGGLERGTETPY